MSFTALSNSFSSSFIPHPYNRSLFRIRALSWGMGALQFACFQPLSLMALVGQLFSLALTIASPSVITGTRVQVCFCERFLCIMPRSLGKYSDVQADGKGEETELCLLYPSPAWGISNSFFRTVRLTSILYSWMHLLPYWIFPSLPSLITHWVNSNIYQHGLNYFCPQLCKNIKNVKSVLEKCDERKIATWWYSLFTLHVEIYLLLSF